jgi:hypothetical protein
MQIGYNYIEFCEYDETNCPFQGYCNSCSNFDIEDKNHDIDNFEGSNEIEFD